MTSSHEWNHKSGGKFFPKRRRSRNRSEKARKSQSNATVTGFRSTKINTQEFKKHQTNLSSYKFYKLYEAQSVKVGKFYNKQ